MSPSEAQDEARLVIRRRRRVDLAIGIPVGLIVGIAILVAFLFFGSEGTIDAPRISGIDSGKPAKVRQSDDATSPSGSEVSR